jgi:16S rRNA (cytosine1402-N4)-methyltransferase
MHIPVLLKEVLDGLRVEKGDIVLDGTLNRGGHARELCSGAKGVRLIGLDADADAVQASEELFSRVAPDCEHYFVVSNFRNLDTVLDGLKIPRVNKILFDLGLSSNQLEESGRGFSFQKDEPLNMAFDAGKSGVTAEVAVNEWEEESLADILHGFGEERFGRRIARAIVEAREKGRIQTTKQLTEILKEAIPKRHQIGKLHYATRTFQALRIAVNDELGALTEGLEKGYERLTDGGRIAVISFQSLEDRIVKRFFKEKESGNGSTILTKKPIVPTEEELKENPRARSAKLRILKK